MSEYAIGVFAICLVGGALMKLSYGSADLSRLAIAIITIYVISAPLVSAIKDADFEGVFEEIGAVEGDFDAEYEPYAKSAFEKGICLAVAKEFSLDEGNIEALASGFNFQSMRAEGIKVILSGRAAMGDYRQIEEYLNNLDIGECRVEIKIG